MQACDREGQFQGLITEYGLRKFDTGSIAVQIKGRLDKLWNSVESLWDNWADYQMEAEGSLFIITKKGEPNPIHVESLVRNAGWDGKITSISDGTWQPIPCQFAIQRDDYNGQTRYKIAFVNGLESSPERGKLGNLDANDAKALEATYGAKLRAIVGNIKRNQAPGGAPPAPPPATLDCPPSGADIPF